MVLAEKLSLVFKTRGHKLVCDIRVTKSFFYIQSMGFTHCHKSSGFRSSAEKLLQLVALFSGLQLLAHIVPLSSLINKSYSLNFEM